MNNTMKKMSLLAPIVALSACAQKDRAGEETVPPMYTDDVVAAHEPMEVEPTEVQTGLILVEFDPGLVAMCDGLKGNKAFFEFDSAKVQPEYRERLKKIADCAESGDLKGQTLQLVGTADPRGTYEYNWELGGRRAEAVANILREEGVDPERISTMSIGEFGAPPESMTTAQFERRVMIRLLPSLNEQERSSMGNNASAGGS